MRERSREDRFDEVYPIVLIVVALSFDILYASGRIPIAEIAVFVFVLILWAYGNLRGGIWEYPSKLGSFNLSIILLTNFYVTSIYGDLALLGLWERVMGAIGLPFICVLISTVLVSYLKDTLDRQITWGVLLGGTLGYMISMSSLLLFIF